MILVKIVNTCKKQFPFAPVVRLVLVYLKQLNVLKRQCKCCLCILRKLYDCTPYQCSVLGADRKQETQQHSYQYSLTQHLQYETRLIQIVSKPIVFFVFFVELIYTKLPRLISIVSKPIALNCPMLPFVALCCPKWPYVALS